MLTLNSGIWYNKTTDRWRINMPPFGKLVRHAATLMKMMQYVTTGSKPCETMQFVITDHYKKYSTKQQSPSKLSLQSKEIK